MDESASQPHHEPGGDDTGELIQFGGLPVRSPFGEIRLPRIPRSPVAIALTTLAIGLLIGFFGGRLTAHQAGRPPQSRSPVSTPLIVPQLATTAIAFTGARCAVQIDNHLQLGIEIINQTPRPVTLGTIRPEFPLGGLRVISSGVGTCGALPAATIPSPGSLSPDATEWINTTVAVRLACPEPLPVWFRISYTSAGKAGTTLLAAFPDLGPVSYRHCQNTENASSIIANVENGAKNPASQ